MTEQHVKSVKLFFQTFANHLQRIRDDGTDANQAYRAQILLGQLHQFEKSILESDGDLAAEGGDQRAFKALLSLEDCGSLAQWLVAEQNAFPVQAVFFLDSRGIWTLLAGEGPVPDRLRVEEWLTRGRVARLADERPCYTCYLYGQPRLILAFRDADESNASARGQFVHFISRLLPLFIQGRVKDAPSTLGGSTGIIAKDVVFLEVLGLIEKAAKKDVSMLLEGESGTGKEVIANFIHRKSPRATKPLVAVNCAAIPAGLIESELFGHEKGAFTGAYHRQIGRVEEADGGTLFLDEIGEMELAMQAKLLRFLQLHEFHRVGGKQKISVDVRIVAATNRNLKEQVAQGNFREDLYYRLSVMPFTIPPLRDRVDDIVSLSRYFFEKYGESFGIAELDIDPMVFDLLAAYDFPGNVRELENLIQNVLVFAQSEKIKPLHLPESIRGLDPKGMEARDGSGRMRKWQKRSSFGRRFKMRARSRSVDSAVEASAEVPDWMRSIPRDNDELKQLKQDIQNFASDLTLKLEHRFLKNLLDRAEGSMPKASKIGNINRTLLYKMIDRTKHLEEDQADSD
ncbi:Sigma 54-interacting transcriptional regulator [Sulfidibacter corallicola]|uniref:Sigma 54-interacting transcriptional regulator n=1 Tax=Sulfidibacter corallicola TaxID=2818388 RepID=A0A8A4TWI0_SULCO|nr:sigma 54-interacting transcriptional regulator [Sulfidibacter corallicola]QTD54299.1 sigma 54-interacting transcriptional regulator [Sulfidibacter corallicola]